MEHIGRYLPENFAKPSQACETLCPRVQILEERLAQVCKAREEYDTNHDQLDRVAQNIADRLNFLISNCKYGPSLIKCAFNNQGANLIITCQSKSKS